MARMAATELSQTELTHLHSLVQVLLPHPGGLRRWSVMRAVRALHEKATVEIPLKLEDEVERVFRRHGGDVSECAGFDPVAQRDVTSRLFYRPKDRAGEVWAVDADTARAWLKSINRIDTDEPRNALPI